MKSKKRFALLLCTLLVFMSAVSSSVFADAGNGKAAPHDKIKIHTEFNFGSGFTLYSVDESQSLGYFTSWGGGYEKNGPEENLGGSKILVTDEGQKYEVVLSINGNGNHQDDGEATDNYWIKEAKLIEPPVDPPAENGALIIHKTANLVGTYIFEVNGKTVSIGVTQTDTDTQSAAVELPEGTYTVSENDASVGGYTLVTKVGLSADSTTTATEAIVQVTAGETSHVYFENGYTEISGPKYDVTFTKALVVEEGSLDPAFETEKGLDFQFVLSDGTNTYKQIVNFSTIEESKAVLFKDVVPGTYTLTEVAVPEGWVSSISEGVTVTVSEEGEISFDGTVGFVVTNTYNVQEEPPVAADVHFSKNIVVAEASAALSIPEDGITFKFVLTGENDFKKECAVTLNGIEDQQRGIFEDVPAGQYTMREEGLPEGWTSSIESGITVTVDEDGGVTGIPEVITNTYYVPPLGPPIPPIDPPIVIPPVDPPVVDPVPDPDPQPLPDDEFLEDPDQENGNEEGNDVVKPALPEDEHLELDPVQKQRQVDADVANPDQPKTGDEQNVEGWLSILLLALTAMGIIISTKRKNEGK